MYALESALIMHPPLTLQSGNRACKTLRVDVRHVS